MYIVILVLSLITVTVLKNNNLFLLKDLPSVPMLLEYITLISLLFQKSYLSLINYALTLHYIQFK